MSLAVISVTAVIANGLATARAATPLMAVESLRRRRFGTEISLNLDNENVCYEFDGTDEKDVTRVVRSNCEAIAT